MNMPLPNVDTAPIRVLIVEDSEDDVVLLCAELAETGRRFTYRCADSADSMAAALNNADWDIVISDHAMPSFSSQEALGVLKRSGKDIPFIIYSGTISEQTAVAALRNGVHDCVQKGNFARLFPSIERELRNAAVRREKQHAEKHIYRLAYYDDLTGLPNRNLFRERVGEVLRQNPVATAAVYFLNIDRFMRINNTFGFAVGDVVLQQLAGRLQACLGESELLARFRGDDFAVFKSDVRNSAEIQARADSIMAQFATPFVHDKLEFFITASMGICTFPQDGDEVDTLLKNAESAMSLAKRLWRNNYKYYLRELGETAAHRLALETALRHAVERKEFILDYQPIFAVATGELLGCEALVRWRHPELGVLPPDRFIPLADESGLIIGMGEWVLREACRQMKAWHDRGHRGLSISVNVSAVQFAQSQLQSQIAEVLRDTGLDPQCLELEITETVLMRDADSTIRTLRGLKEMGIRISMDDFGTGYSSLSYLKRFPIDTLKIDKSFMRDITSEIDSKAIVLAIAALAQNLKLVTLAEGVETVDQLNHLRNIRCERMQGFLFSRPLSAENFERFIAARELKRAVG